MASECSALVPGSRCYCSLSLLSPRYERQWASGGLGKGFRQVRLGIGVQPTGPVENKTQGGVSHKAS